MTTSFVIITLIASGLTVPSFLSLVNENKGTIWVVPVFKNATFPNWVAKNDTFMQCVFQRQVFQLWTLKKPNPVLQKSRKPGSLQQNMVGKDRRARNCITALKLLNLDLILFYVALNRLISKYQMELQFLSSFSLLFRFIFFFSNKLNKNFNWKNIWASFISYKQFLNVFYAL